MGYLEIELQRREDALRDNRPDYMAALRHSEEFDYKPVVDILFSYRPGEQPEKAIFVLAQCQTLLQEQQKALRVVKEYESREKQLSDLKTKLPSK